MPLLLVLSILGVSTHGGEAATATNAPAVSATQERNLCTTNLTVIYQAIQRYREDRRDLPNWLSDLVPNYISDARILVCPVCRRTGRIEQPPLADPKLPSSYLFEFCPVPLGSLAPNSPHRTRREWKRRQMGMLGAEVPIVRCRHHYPVLNLAFSGQIYESLPQWEQGFTNRISTEALSAGSLFADDPPSGQPLRFPSRDGKAKAGQLDLTRFYNVTLSESAHQRADDTLASLPPGLRTLAGVEFDIRGLIQLGSRSLTNKTFPEQVINIPVRQKCKRLHFLHATSMGTARDEGTLVAAYVLRFAGNEARLEIPVVYGRELRDWHVLRDEPPLGNELTVAWTGTNAASTAEGRSIRLFKTTWVNLAPELEIQSIDFVSKKAGPAPFLIAITAE